jgi:hypothetical protein
MTDYVISEDQLKSVIDLTEEMCETPGWVINIQPIAQRRMDIIIAIRSRQLSEHDAAIRNATLTSLLQVVKIREDEMARKANLTENMTTATGYFTSAGALNWVVQEIEKSLRTQEHP